MLKFLATVAMAAMCCSGIASAQQAPFTVDGNVALQSFVSLTDAHIRTTLDALQALSATSEARSADWNRIQTPLRQAAQFNVPAVLFFAMRSGKYWTVDKGIQPTSLSDRPYFARVLAGQVVVGELVLSRSTGKPVAVVAVPVRGTNGNVVGVLGASIYLDPLTALLKAELGNGPGTVFWAIDSHGITALHSDPSNIFNDAAKMSPELNRAIKHMLATDSGVENYSYKGKARTVIYRKSTLTGWTYGFGIVH
jgi:hypothetical protein